jgi:ubiquinone/menaquinone biosynthesis C-methylase UbiE
MDLETNASAATRRILEIEEQAVVERCFDLGIRSGTVLDVGTGSGLIPVRLALRNPDLVIHALDLSSGALGRAARNATEWGVGLRILLNHGDGTQMPFEDDLFDAVVCNLVLHRVSDPVALIRQMGRVCKDSGVLFLRDLRRPQGLFTRIRAGWRGRRYSGEFRRAFEAGLQSAFTLSELRELVAASGVSRLKIISMGESHLGFERPAIRADLS